MAMALALPSQQLPEKGKLAEELLAYIGHFPLFEFVTDCLQEELSERFEYSSGASQKLEALAGYENTKKIAERLIGSFASLPWQYMLTMQLPDAISDVLKVTPATFPIGTALTINRDIAALSSAYPINSQHVPLQRLLHGGNGLLSLSMTSEPRSVEWSAGSYLQIETSGYVDAYGSTAPAQNVLHTIRTFFGLGIALDLFNVKRQYSPYKPTLPIYVHRKIGDDWRIVKKFEVQELHASTMASVVPSDRCASTEGKNRAALIAEFLSDFHVINLAGEKGQSIQLACQWLFDGYAERDELLRFVQGVVALEILLGDKRQSDELGLGALLRNRCAYFIADTVKEREEILSDINKIYGVRSRIMHNGVRQFTPEDRALFRKLRGFCFAIIRKEIALLRREFLT